MKIAVRVKLTVSGKLNVTETTKPDYTVLTKRVQREKVQRESARKIGSDISTVTKRDCDSERYSNIDSVQENDSNCCRKRQSDSDSENDIIRDIHSDS